MSRSRAASLALEQVVLRRVAVAGVSLVVTAAVIGTLVLVLMWSASFRGGPNDLALGILHLFVLIGVGVVTLVVVGALAARWWQLPHPVVVGVGGPLAAVALVPDVAEHPVTRVRPELSAGVPAPGGAPRAPVGVLDVETARTRTRIEPLPTADLSCAGLFDRSVRPGIPYSSQRDACEQLSGDRWLVRVPATSRPWELVALRPDALVSVALRDPSSGDPADNLALMQRMVESLVPTTAERLAELPQEWSPGRASARRVVDRRVVDDVW